jgi:Skp family chaperone for outer membrane proteins
MKRIPLFAATALVGLAVLTSPAQAEVKLGYIDSEVLRERLPEFKQIQRELERLKQDYEQQAVDRQSKLVKLQDDFQKQELLMSEVRKAEMQASFEKQVQELQQFTQEKLGPNGELFRKNIELSQPIFEQINTALEAIAEKDGYDFIFDVAGNGAIVYADPDRFNLTEKLLTGLEEAREEREQ